MKKIFSKLLLCLGIFSVATAWARAQNIGVPIRIGGVGGWYENLTTASLTISTTSVPSVDCPYGNFSFTLTNPSGVSSAQGAGTAVLLPDKVYTISYSGTNCAGGQIFITAPQGYQVYINSRLTPEYSFNIPPNQAGNFTGGGGIQVEVVSPNALSARAGVASSITSGQIRWQVALGFLINGNTAGAITLADPGTGSSWSVFTRTALQYMAPSSEIVTYNDGVGLRQILADQADVDLVDINSTSYSINFYNPSTRQGSAFPYTHTGSWYVSYQIQQGATATTLQITKTTLNLGSNATARTAITTLTRTGTSLYNYNWVLDDWNDSGQAQVKEETRQWGQSSTKTNNNGVGDRTEALTVYTPNSGKTDLTVNNTFQTFNWGDQLINTSLGSTSSATSTTAFYQLNSATNYALPQSVTAATGTWAGFDYNSAPSSPLWYYTLSHQYKPFNNMAMPGSFSITQGEVSTFTFLSDAFGSPTRPASILTQVNGTTTAETNISYTGSTAPDGFPMVKSTQTDNYSGAASGYLTTVTQYYQENAGDAFFASQTRSFVKPDGSQVSYAYQRGTFNANQIGQAAFTANTSGTCSSIAAITGSNISTNGTAYTTYNGYTIDTIYLVNGKSTMQVTLRDSLALVRSVQAYAWVGGNWVLVGYTNYTYDASGQLTSTSAINGAATSTINNGDQVLYTIDASGIILNYIYDHAGRVASVAKSSGPTTTYYYNSLGQVTSCKLSGGGTDAPIINSAAYDDAGRITSETPAGLQAVIYSYAYGSSAGLLISNATYVRTTTYPDTGTRIEAQQLDGRALSVSGTAVVEQDYTYAIELTTYSGYLDTTVNLGGATARWNLIVTDWLGRTVRSTHPGFTGQPNFVQTNIYDTSGTGHLIEVDRTGFAPAKFQYDALGSVILSGMDLGNDNLALASNDVITASNQFVELYNGNYWLHEESDVYPTASSSTPLTTAIKRTLLTGFPANCFAQTQTTDVYGNVGTQAVTVNTASQTLTTTTTIPGVTNSQVGTVTNGLRTQVVGVDGLTTYFGYDGLERPKTVTDSRGNTTTKAYVSGSSLASSVTDMTGVPVVTYNSYDGLGRPLVATNASGYTTNWQYNVRGQVLEQWGTAVHPVAYGYDPIYGDRLSMTTYQGDTTLGGGTEFTGSTWPTTNASSCLPATTQWFYDGPSGLLSSKEDPAGKYVRYTYNAAGQTATRSLARTVNNTPITTTYTYDTNTGLGNGTGTGELLGLTYSDSTHPVSYTYTRFGQLKSVSDATGSRAFNYTNSSQPTELDSLSLDSNFYFGRILTQKYNSDGLLPGRPTGFQLGNSSNPSADLSQTFGYTGQGHYSSFGTVSQGGANSVTFNYGYMSNAPLVSSIGIAGNSNYAVSRGYEAHRNLLTSITNNWGSGTVTQFNYGYNALQQRTFSMQSGSAYADYYSGTSYSSVFNFHTYDSYGQLISRAMYRDTPSTSLTSPGSGDMLPARSFQFAYDAIGNRQEVGENVWGTPPNRFDTYAVDATGLNEYSSRTNDTIRVLGNVNVGATVSVSGNTTINVLDRNFGGDFLPSNTGGAATGTIAVSAAMPNNSPINLTPNRSYFVPAQTQSFGYDFDGNLTSDGLWTYTYDAENRLVSMVSQLGTGLPNGNTTLSFTYDYLNRRVEKKVFNTATQNLISDRRYIYDGWNLVAETDTSGNIQRSYTWGLDLAGSLSATGGVGALLEITNYTYSGGSLVGTTNYFPQFDGNGNVAALVRSDGLTAAVYEYGPFGELLRNEAFDSAIADNPFRFSTKFLDLETGLVNYGNRYYSPSLGRFLNRDPIEEAGGLNLYGFCGNDGINNFDVMGNSWLSKLWDPR